MIRFSKYLWIYFFISALVLVPGVYSLVRYGLVQSIDFTGGTLLEVKFDKNVSTDTVGELAKKASLPVASVQKTSTDTYR